MSCYLEAVGDLQEVGSGAKFTFDTSEDYLDTAGDCISFDPESGGTIITINRPGLYKIEWSLNYHGNTLPITVGITENDAPSSAISAVPITGNMSSGALINLTAAELPYRISLVNFGEPISLYNHPSMGNTAVSIRVHLFADGELDG